MNRRDCLRVAVLLPCLPFVTRTATPAAAQSPVVSIPASRVRPGDAAWPSEQAWQILKQAVGGRLSKVQSPLEVCHARPDGAECAEVFKELKNPYFIGDDPALTQTTGWIDAWTWQPSAYCVSAQTSADVVAAVDFARTHDLRLVVRGGSHSYLGTSTALDSLEIWTRSMKEIVMHDAFIGEGRDGRTTPQPAVSVGAGAIWMHTYNAVTTRGRRYVQGGGCGTVGVAGLVQGGGFGGYSKQFGTAGSNLLEAEIVTADGQVRITNACLNPELFWALKGGGGGTFGVVTRLTLRTHEPPDFIGIVSTKVEAKSDAAYRELLGGFVDFCGQNLVTRHWGETTTLRRGNKLEIGMEFQGIDETRTRDMAAVPRLDRILQFNVYSDHAGDPQRGRALSMGCGFSASQCAGGDAAGRSTRRVNREHILVGQSRRGRSLHPRL
jgi:hypothetical protein